PAAGPELTRFDPGDRVKHSAQGGLGDLTTVEAALRGRIFLHCKLMRGPNCARIELFSCFQYRHAPTVFAVGNRPVERGGPAVAQDAGMNDQAEMARPNLLRNGDLEHWCNDKIRRLAGDGGDHCLVIRCNANADVVATLAKLDPQTLAEAVMGRRQKENSHKLSP